MSRVLTMIFDQSGHIVVQVLTGRKIVAVASMIDARAWRRFKNLCRAVGNGDTAPASAGFLAAGHKAAKIENCSVGCCWRQTDAEHLCSAGSKDRKKTEYTCYELTKASDP